MRTEKSPGGGRGAIDQQGVQALPTPVSPCRGGVYGEAFDAYRDAGWLGVLPIPARQKKPVPAGYTGRDGAWPSYSDVYDWSEQFPDGNIALRLPAGVIGIDVDHYDGKDGGGTLAALQDAYGQLPATWRTGSRADGVSGIRLYRVPERPSWPGDLGKGIEIIQTRHRYAVVWPSVHPNGGTYRWTGPDGVTCASGVPSVADLAPLPQSWVDALTSGAPEREVTAASLEPAAVNAWLAAHGAGDPCRRMAHAAHGYAAALALGQRSRHDSAMGATMGICYLAAEGHNGALEALSVVRAAFLDAVAGDRTPEEAAAEWDRLHDGAVNIAAAGSVAAADPCADPLNQLDGLIMPEDRPVALAAPSAEAAVKDADAPEQLSWDPIDLTTVLAGTAPQLNPTLMKRTDGAFLLYPGMVHSFNGEPESGKSMIALGEIARLLMAGEPVLLVDFESDEATMCERLLAMGATPRQILNHLHYLRPQIAPSSLTMEGAAWERRLSTRYALVVLDGVTEAFSVYGVGTMNNDEVTAWIRRVPKRLAARTGAAVVLVDHVVKNAEAQGRFAIGAQAKLAGLTGASYMVEVLEPIGKGMAGRLALRVGKDRPGMIRPKSGAYRKGDRSQEAAVAVIDSTTPGTIRYRLEPPRTAVDEERVPHELMEKVSRAIEDEPRPPGFNRILTMVAGKKTSIREAVDLLAAGGYIRIDRGGNNTQFHSSVRPYRRDSLHGLLTVSECPP